MSYIETLMLIFALIVLTFFEYKRGFSKRQIVISMLILVPVLFFSLNMLTDAVTIDEPQYINLITNIKHLKAYDNAYKMFKQYKLSQLFVGTEFLVISKIINHDLSQHQLWAAYKILHWSSLFVVILFIVHCFDKWLARYEKNRFFMDIAVLSVLLGLPLSCLILKINNYDAFGAYFIVLGYILLLSGVKHNKNCLFYLSGLTVALGVMEKGVNLPYWLLDIVLICYFSTKNNKLWREKLLNGTLISAKCVAVSVGANSVYYLVTYILQDGFYINLHTSDIFNSFVGTLSNFGSLPVKPYFIVILMTLTFPFLSSAIDFIISSLDAKGYNTVKIFLNTDALMLLFIMVSGVLGAYFIRAMKSPFVPIKEGYYLPKFLFNDTITHYGAKTFIGHYFCKICNSCGVIMLNFPVIVVAIILGVLVICIKKLYDKKAFEVSVLIFAMIAILFVFNLLDCPMYGRYYAVPILMTVIISIYLCGMYFSPIKRAAFMRIIALFLVYCIEMAMFIPNVKVFSPLWLWHDSSFNTKIEKGVSYVGAVFLWGEEISICGKAIDSIVRSEGKYSPEEITIYTYYGHTWPSNPGYQILLTRDMVKEGEKIMDFKFDDKSYYIINKTKIYRYDLPEFIYDVKPVYSLGYKGETGVWVYRGDQLAQYSDWFEDSLKQWM